MSSEPNNISDAVTKEDELAREFYCSAASVLLAANIDFLVGGAFASYYYTGVERHTKDFDIFVRPKDVQPALDALAKAGYKTAIPYPHWLAKAYCGDSFMDIIFNSGNGVTPVDDLWFERAIEAEVMDIKMKLCPPEEIIWSKAFVMERERYDGADVAHLIHARAETLDWQYLINRFGENWQVLLSHLILFGFIYPTERTKIPASVMEQLTTRLQKQLTSPANLTEKLCQGTLISREQYLTDVEQWGYVDARLEPNGNLTKEQLDIWTASIGQKEE